MRTSKVPGGLGSQSSQPPAPGSDGLKHNHHCSCHRTSIDEALTLLIAKVLDSQADDLISYQCQRLHFLDRD